MIPIDVNEQLAAVAAPPQGVRGQHSSPSSGAARASADEALFWHFVCDEICEVLCEVLCDDADDARAADTLTASAASTLKGRRAEDADAPIAFANADADADADRPACELPHVASAASPWVSACADLLEAAKDLTNMRGLREPLTSCGFRCGPPLSTTPGNFGVWVPPDYPCYYDLVGKNMSIQNYASSLPTLRKYLDGALALARTGGAYRTDYKQHRRRQDQSNRLNRAVHHKTSRFTGVSWTGTRWHASIGVRGPRVKLGDFDDEEDAARAYDAAVVKYELTGRTLNFPGEVPRADVLDALPLPPPLPTRSVATRQIERERRPSHALPRGTTYPDGAMAPSAANLAAAAGPASQKDGGEPKMKKLGGYQYHNAQNWELAKAMVESDPATAQLGTQKLPAPYR